MVKQQAVDSLRLKAFLAGKCPPNSCVHKFTKNHKKVLTSSYSGAKLPLTLTFPILASLFLTFDILIPMKILKRFVIVLMIGCLSFLFSSVGAAVAAPSGWFDRAWTKRIPITVDNSTGTSTLSNFPVKITVPYESNMKNDFSDLRFTDSDGKTALNYFIESYSTSSSAIVWVKVPSIPALSTREIEMYFGNPAAISASNGSSVFSSYDDFNDGIFNTANFGIITNDPYGFKAKELNGNLVAESNSTSSSSNFGYVNYKNGLNGSNLWLTSDFQLATSTDQYASKIIAADFMWPGLQDWQYRNTYAHAAQVVIEPGTRTAYLNWTSSYGGVINSVVLKNDLNVVSKKYTVSLGLFNGKTYVTITDTSTGINVVDRVVNTTNYSGSLYPAVGLYTEYGEWGGNQTKVNFDNFRAYHYSPSLSTLVGVENTSQPLPFTTITLAPNRPDAYDGWYKTPPTITLTSDKPGVTYYQWDSTSGPWTTYSTALNYPSSFDKKNDGSGKHTLYFYSTSGGYNDEDVRFFAFKVDSDYKMPAAGGGACDSCHGEGSTLIGGDHLSWYRNTPHDLALNNKSDDGYPAVLPDGSTTRCTRCHYNSMTNGPDGKPISPRYLRVTGANAEEPDGITDPGGVLHTVLGNDNTVCFACHTQSGGAYGGKDTFEQVKHAQNSGFASPKAATRWPDKSFGQGQCGNCHNPHGVEGTTDYRLKNKNELCKTCHDAKLPLTEKMAIDGLYNEPAKTGSFTLFSQKNSDNYPYTPTLLIKAITLGKTASYYLGAEDTYSMGILQLSLNSDLYKPYGTTVKVYVNNTPSTTGASLIDSWSDTFYREGSPKKDYNIAGWLNNNKNDALYILIEIPAGSYGPRNIVLPTSIEYLYQSVYMDNPPANAFTNYAYQGNPDFNNSSHGSTTNALTIWPNPAETGAIIGSGGATAGECINCHNPHGKDNDGKPFKKMLAENDEDLCFKCHDKPETSERGINIMDRFKVSETSIDSAWKLERATARHSVFNDNTGQQLECSSCHNPHLNNRDNKVIDPNNKASLFTKKTTDPVTGLQVPDYNDFCLKCHGKTIPVTPLYTGLIRVQRVADIDYSQNFHGGVSAIGSYKGSTRDILYGPMKPPYYRGMGPLTCTNCHDEHGSSNAFHIKESINGQTVDMRDGAAFSYATGWRSLCLSCHEFSSAVNAHGPVNCSTGGGCHTTSDTTWITKDLPPNGCINCHTHGGPLKGETVPSSIAPSHLFGPYF